MKRWLILLLILASFVWYAFSFFNPIDDTRFVTHIVDLNKQQLNFYWKDSTQKRFGSFTNLKRMINSKGSELVFAMNGGMYNKKGFPQGLYIEKGEILSEVDLKEKEYGNFYMQPNGVFYITENAEAKVCRSTDFVAKEVKFATQSGPMLLLDGKIHPKFIKGSSNLHIRNAVGILPNGSILFAMSKQKINFYDLALFFKSYGCENALYLDGFVSRTYLPQKDFGFLAGNFGVIIAEITDN